MRPAKSAASASAQIGFESATRTALDAGGPVPGPGSSVAIANALVEAIGSAGASPYRLAITPTRSERKTPNATFSPLTTQNGLPKQSVLRREREFLHLLLGDQSLSVLLLPGEARCIVFANDESGSLLHPD